MNKILWDLINTGEVVSFIDNIIEGTEEEERYDKVVKEVVRRLVSSSQTMDLVFLYFIFHFHSVLFFYF